MKGARWQSSSFGDFLCFDKPLDCDVIVVGVHKGQIVPVRVMLPHQLYRQTVAEILKEHGAQEIHVIPYNSKELRSFTAAELFCAPTDDQEAS